MKKFLTLIAAALFSAGAFADSYTLTFKTNGANDASSLIKDTTSVANVIDQGTQYVSGFHIGPGGTTTLAYLGKDGCGLKFGNSNNGANLVITMSALGQVKADSIVVSASAWKGTTDKFDTPNAVINGQSLTIPADETFRNYTINLDGSLLDSIYVSKSASGRWYLKSITVYYAQGNSFDPAIAHSPRYAAGKTYEVLLGPDMVDETKTLNGAAKKGISDLYQWIKYTNPTSTLDDGTAEVSTSNRWTDINPELVNDTSKTFIQVKGLYNNEGSVYAPCIDYQDYGKFITFYVKDTKRFVAFATGSASSNAANLEYIHVVAKAADGSSVVEGKSTPGKIYGKGSSSDFVGIDLDPTKAYEITIQDACDADHAKGKATVMLTGIQLWGVDSVPGVGVRKAVTDSYSYWQTLLGPDMIAPYVAADGKTYYKTVAEGVKYTNPTDVDTDGTNRVQVSNRWTNLDPTTFASDAYIQIKGKDGSVNAPVITKRWGKYIEFNVTGTKIFRVFGVGSSSNNASDNNAMYLTVTPFNNNAGVFTTNSTPGKIFGKGTSADSVSVVLNPKERYTIRIETADKVEGGKDQDIMITGINLQNEQGIAEQAENLGTLNRTIKAAVDAKQDTVELEAGQSYTLNGEAPVSKMTILGNGAKVVTNATGQITATSSIIVDGVKFDCANSTVAPVALSATPDPETYTYGKKYGEPIYYDQHEVDSINALGGDSVSTTTIKDYTEAYKYAGASQKVYEAELIQLKNSEFNNLKTSLVSGNKQPYALLKLDIDNTNAFFAYKQGNDNIDGNATIDWYGGPNCIKDINIVNSTLANDSVNTVYFIRYTNAANARPVKVFGTGASASWVMKNNTLVNLRSSGNFADRYVSDATDTLTWTGNVIANCSRLNRAAGNCVKNFTAADNIGFGNLDGTDKTQILTEDSIVFNPNNKAHEFYLASASKATKLKFGDPDWVVEYQTAPLNLVVTQTQNKDFVAAINDFLATSEAPEQITVSFQEAGEYPTSGELNTIAPVTFRADSIEAGSATIVAKHGMVLGAGFTFDGVNINADSLTTPVITLQTNEYKKSDTSYGYYNFGDIYLKNMKASGMKSDLIYGNKKANLIGTLSTENSEIYMAAAKKTVYNFNGGGLPVNFIFKNSTLDAAQSYMYSTQSGVKASQWGIDMLYYTIENASIINPGKKFFQHRQDSQKWLTYTLKNSLVLVSSERANFVSDINAGSTSSNPTWVVDGNAFQQLAADSTCTDVASKQNTGDKEEPVKNNVEGTMTFNSLVQPINLGGIFTLSNDSVEAPTSLGDPRWTITFTRPVAGDVTYFLKEGDLFTSGQIVNVVDSARMDSVATIQYGEAGGNDFAAAKLDGNAPEGYIASTGGNGVNGNKTGGTFYTIVPKYDGVISAAVILNAGKAFHLTVDGVQDSTFDGNQVENKFYGNVTFNVKAGSSYKFYCDGSKLGFYGFNYKYGDKVEPVTEVSITDLSTGIDNVNVSEKKVVFDPNAPIYNLAGQRVGNDYKGVVIQNGRKYIKK